MGLNKSKGNMYDFVTHTWNTIKGACPHGCSYCSIKRIAKRFNQEQKPARFDESELNTNLGSGNFIFVGSSNDLFCRNNDFQWIEKTLKKCLEYPENRYLFQTKDPQEMRFWKSRIPKNSIACITLESNRHYPEIMRNAPVPFNRALYFKEIYLDRYITIEPIMDFGLGAFVEMIKSCNPIQVNIGADSGNNNLPEPSKEKIGNLILELGKFTRVFLKPNLVRIKNSGNHCMTCGKSLPPGKSILCKSCRNEDTSQNIKEKEGER